MSKKKMTFTVKIPRKARRATELYSVEFNFGPKTVQGKMGYQRNPKHKKRDD